MPSNWWPRISLRRSLTLKSWYILMCFALNNISSAKEQKTFSLVYFSSATPFFFVFILFCRGHLSFLSLIFLFKLYSVLLFLKWIAIQHIDLILNICWLISYRYCQVLWILQFGLLRHILQFGESLISQIVSKQEC